MVARLETGAVAPGTRSSASGTEAGATATGTTAPVKLTPMLVQFFAAKEEQPDAILFFRLGDFYEMFFEDAVEAAKILDITLTTRGKGPDGEPMQMCGVPHHAAKGYLQRLIEAGRKVAICEQVEDPKTTKGIVKRAIVQVVTPGVRLDSEGLDARRHNYLLSLWPVEGGRWALAYCDVSTGSLRASEIADRETLLRELVRVDPAEVLLPEGAQETEALVRETLSAASVTRLPSTDGEARSPSSPGPGDAGASAPASPGLQAGAKALLAFLDKVNPGARAALGELEIYETAGFMVLDASARRNLELFETLFERRRKGSLLGVVDQCETAMGARLLREWLAAPLLSLEGIEARQEGVAEALERRSLRQDLRAILGGLGDLDRLTTRCISGLASPRDLGALRDVLAALPDLLERVQGFDAPILSESLVPSFEVASLGELLARALRERPPVVVRDGGIFQEGYDPELDEWSSLKANARDWLLEYQDRLREESGIPKLKVGYNKVFGYYIEVTRANLALVPESFIRKQTLAAGERYYTPELKEHETRILEADDRIQQCEARLFEALREACAAQGQALLAIGRGLARLDVISSFAELAESQAFVRPRVDASLDIVITEGRHPMVEQTLGRGRFIPNDVLIEGDTSYLHIITGPNMAGKSTIMRQVALIAILAQAGSFVPAMEARIGVVDGVYTRVGASDNLVAGQSTFMVEMLETASILTRATRQSLLLLDEIGRGTSTFDGLSIAWSVAEYIHDKLCARTLFATHYHELCELEKTKPGVKNLSIAVKEWNDEILFLRKLVAGGTSRSYGIQVAKLAGLPDALLERAREVLANLERGELDEYSRPRLSKTKRSGSRKPATDAGETLQISLFGAESLRQAETYEWLKDEVQALDPDHMTPFEALRFIADLRQRLKT